MAAQEFRRENLETMFGPHRHQGVGMLPGPMHPRDPPIPGGHTHGPIPVPSPFPWPPGTAGALPAPRLGAKAKLGCASKTPLGPSTSTVPPPLHAPLLLPLPTTSWESSHTA